MPGRTATSKDLPANWNFELISNGATTHYRGSAGGSIVLNKIYDSEDDKDRPNKYRSRMAQEQREDETQEVYGERVAAHGKAHLQEAE